MTQELFLSGPIPLRPTLGREGESECHSDFRSGTAPSVLDAFLS